jgi:hypothetical protein
MQHNFFYKKLGTLELQLLNSLKNIVPKLVYKPEPDFPENVLTINQEQHSPEYIYFTIVRNQTINYLSQFFDKTGHITSNITKQLPMTYLAEHSDSNTIYTDVTPADNIIKLQIPIITNPGVGMMWAPSLHDWACTHFEEGNIYIIDNVRKHSAVNMGPSDRYYITSRWKVDSLLDKSILD